MTRALPTIPPELVVLDEAEACPYLPMEMARRPLRVPLRPLTPDELDERLAQGDRRSGPFLYNQSCPRCRACEALRVDVERFVPSRSQRRVLRKTTPRVSLELGPCLVSSERVALFSRHELERGLRLRSQAVDEEEYGRFLVQSCVPTFEMRYRLREDGRLVGIAVVDRSRHALSAVYTYYDPDYAELSLGTFSILQQLELCRREGLRWLYLGLSIEGNAHMLYKRRDEL
jgi:leucyl-tRNA---protein transferase